MSKLRKYNMKNKRSFIIILILSILVVCIFSLFIYKYINTSKLEYSVDVDVVIQDTNQNYINTEDESILKVRWDGTYYLEYNKEKTTLSNKVITYNTITGGMKLYGKFYEIESDGKVIENKNETILANTTDCKFYKLDDRKYLLVDTKIYSDDYSIEANSYLLVELDKAGNAKLTNNKINLKTISPTVLVTSEYSFDIANEILKYGSYEIDLKKIIGSTNEYKDTSDNKDNNDSSNGGSTNNDNVDNNPGTNTGTSLGTGGGNGIVNGVDTGKDLTLEEVLNKVKMTSVIRFVEGITNVDIDYVIYDPYNEYVSVYVEVLSSNKLDTIYLSKNDTHITIDNLNPNTNYKLNFIYTTTKIDADTGESLISYHTFEQFEFTTLMPEYNISIYKISKVSNLLTYKVDLQEDFNISKVNVRLSFNYQDIDIETGESLEKTAIIDGSVAVTSGSYVLGQLDISDYNIASNTLLKLTILSVETSNGELPINSTYSFRFGR